MFSFLNLKEKLLLLVGPIILVLIIGFQGWQANHWRTEAIKEELLKLQWQSQYTEMAANIEAFNRQAEQLTQAVQQLQNQQHIQSEELHNALQKNQTWSNQPVPDDVGRLFHNRNPHKNAHSLPK